MHIKQIWTNIFSYICIYHLFLFLNSSFKEKQYSLFAFFSGLQGDFSSMLAPKSEHSADNASPETMKGSPKNREEFFFTGW